MEVYQGCYQNLKDLEEKKRLKKSMDSVKSTEGKCDSLIMQKKEHPKGNLLLKLLTFKEICQVLQSLVGLLSLSRKIPGGCFSCCKPVVSS